ncbi:MAG: hypothetical protein WCJ42_01710 [Actinomycetes bacterium]
MAAVEGVELAEEIRAPKPHRPLGQAIGAVTVIAIVQLLLVLMFGWSASRATPHDLRIAVAGPAQATAAVVAGLDQAKPGAFSWLATSDDAAARAAVMGRKAYAALSFTSAGAVLYTAAAASPAVAAMLSQLLPAAIAKATPGTTVKVVSLIGNPANDPNGSGIPISLIPITITSIAAGAILGLLFKLRRRRILGLLGYSIVAGALTTYALHQGLGIITGTWWKDAAVISLACLAISASVAGLSSILGPPGVGLGVLVVFFFGFPFSGAASAWEFVPTPWGHIAQYLPVAALDTTLRSESFFAAAGANAGLTVLGCWAGAGLLLAVIRGSRTGGRSRAPRHSAAA